MIKRITDDVEREGIVLLCGVDFSTVVPGEVVDDEETRRAHEAKSAELLAQECLVKDHNHRVRASVCRLLWKHRQHRSEFCPTMQ